MEIGKFKSGDTINVEVVLNDDKLYISHASASFFWYIDNDAAIKAFDYLEASSMYVEDFGNDYLKGTIDLPAGQTTVFTTIPYDSGWNVFVDGKKVEFYKVFDALIAFDAGEGFHEIELRYFPKLYKIGLLTTAVGVVIFVFIVLFCMNKKFKSKVMSLLPKAKYAPEQTEEQTDGKAGDSPDSETADTSAPPESEETSAESEQSPSEE